MKEEKQSNIFELIHSMDRNEKGYFNKYAKMLGKGDSYIVLFNIISRMTTFDKNLLQKKAALKQISIPNVNNSLHYLYLLVLKSLRLFHEKNYYKQQVDCMRAEADVLIARNLKKQAIKHLTKAEKMAKHHHYYSALIEIQKTKIIQEFAITKKNLMETIQDSYDDLEQNTKALSEELEFRKLKHLSLACIRINRMDINYNYSKILRNISQSELLDAKFKPLSFYSLYYKESIKSSEAILYSNLKAAHIYYKKIIDIWDAQPHMIKVEPVLYQINLTNYLMNSIIIKEAHDFEAQFKKLELIPTRFQNDKIELIQNQIYLSQLYSLNYKALDQAYKDIQKNKSILNKYESKMNFSRLTIIQYNFAIICLIKEAFDEGLYWINKILYSKKVDPKRDVRLFCRIIELIFHYEMEHFEVVESLLDSVWRTRKSEDSFYRYSENILNHFRKLNKCKNKKEIRDSSEIFLGQLEKFSNYSPKPTGIEELTLWAQSKYSGKTIEFVYLNDLY